MKVAVITTVVTLAACGLLLLAGASVVLPTLQAVTRLLTGQ